MNQEIKPTTIVISALVVIVFVAGLLAGIPQYRVWSKGLAGQAQLREAEYSRQVLIEEARAEMEAAKLLREAEVERAWGAAEAMEIIKKEIDDNYLIYLSIQAQKKMADSPNHTTVYIPVGEMGIPLIRDVEK